MALTPMPEVLDAIRAGRIVIVADDEGRENEGDAIMSAELATKESIAWIVRNSSGLLCAPMPRDYADRLNLPIMVEQSQDSRKTAYTLTVDAAVGTTTGISASDRALTMNVLADPTSVPGDLIRPGHVLPLRAVDGGVLQRGGHTEAAVDLMRLAGLKPVGVIAEIVDEDGDMMRMPGLEKLCAREDMPLTTVAAIIEYIEANPLPVRENLDANRVGFEVETTVPTENGTFRMRGYRDYATGAEHVAIIAGNPGGSDVLVRVHSECLTGEALHSQKCECGPQLDAALRKIEADPKGGVVLYMRGHEGRGIGLLNKFKAYKLQEQGMDTLDANLALGFPADDRDYTAAARMLDDMGISSVRLLSNNPEKQRQLEQYGIEINDLVPLLVGRSKHNEGYLNVKRDRMGHQIPENYPLVELAFAREFVA